MDGVETAITTKPMEDNIQIKPNPNHGNFTLEFGQKLIKGGEVNIYSTEGKCIFRKHVAHPGESSIQVEMPVMNPGLYLVKIRTKEGSCEKKILVV